MNNDRNKVNANFVNNICKKPVIQYVRMGPYVEFVLNSNYIYSYYHPSLTQNCLEFLLVRKMCNKSSIFAQVNT